MKDFLKSKTFHWAAVGLLILLVFFLGQKVYKRYLIEREIDKLQAEIVQLDQSNQEILDLINYFKTPEFKERQARSLLSLQKPGEFAVALPPRNDQNQGVEAEGKEDRTAQSNLLEWWDYFFASE